MTTSKTWRERFRKQFSGQTQLSQAILGALEYRGFYDAGKYLDDDIADSIIPVIASFIETIAQEERQAGAEDERNTMGKMTPDEAARYLNAARKGDINQVTEIR